MDDSTDADHPLGFDPKLVEDSGEWQLGAVEGAEEPLAQTFGLSKPGGVRFPIIPLFLVSSALGGTFGTWAIHALNCNGRVENGIVSMAEAAPAPMTQPERMPAADLRPLTTDKLPDIHEPFVPTRYTPRHVLTPLEARFYSNLSRQNPNNDPVLYCRRDGKKVVLYNDIVDVVQQQASDADCAHLYRTLTGKYFYINRRLAEEAGGMVDGLLGRQAARELDYRVERNGRFLRQEKLHGIKVGDTIHFAPYQERERREKYTRR